MKYTFRGCAAKDVSAWWLQSAKVVESKLHAPAKSEVGNYMKSVKLRNKMKCNQLDILTARVRSWEYENAPSVHLPHATYEGVYLLITTLLLDDVITHLPTGLVLVKNCAAEQTSQSNPSHIPGGL